MKILKRGLQKEEIVKVKRYYKSYIATEEDIRLIVNESLKVNSEGNLDKIDWKNNKAYISMESLEASKKIYDNNKHLKVKLYIKSELGTLYNEYKVNSWSFGEKGIELDLA